MSVRFLQSISIIKQVKLKNEKNIQVFIRIIVFLLQLRQSGVMLIGKRIFLVSTQGNMMLLYFCFYIFSAKRTLNFTHSSGRRENYIYAHVKQMLAITKICRSCRLLFTSAQSCYQNTYELQVSI